VPAGCSVEAKVMAWGKVFASGVGVSDS
jgi:hypothetical protein